MCKMRDHVVMHILQSKAASCPRQDLSYQAHLQASTGLEVALPAPKTLFPMFP
jgi:hypothetical protein